MFIAYLEDRGILGPEYIVEASGGAAKTFAGVLESTNATALAGLFGSLRNDFNGDLFVAPCSFDPKAPRARVARAHLATLARFRSGYEEMRKGGGQPAVLGV